MAGSIATKLPESLLLTIFPTYLREMGSQEVTQPVRAWLYAKNLSGLGSAPMTTAYKHWALVVEYLGEDGEVDMQELYEVGRNEEGNVEALNMAFCSRQDREWMNKPGAEKIYLGERTMSQKDAITFCSRVTRKKEQYSLFNNNCQKFVEEFVSLLDGGEMALLPGAKDTCIGRSNNT